MRSLPIVESPLSMSVVDDAVGLHRLAPHDRDFDTLARIAPLSAKHL